MVEDFKGTNVTPFTDRAKARNAKSVSEKKDAIIAKRLAAEEAEERRIEAAHIPEKKRRTTRPAARLARQGSLAAILDVIKIPEVTEADAERAILQLRDLLPADLADAAKKKEKLDSIEAIIKTKINDAIEFTSLAKFENTIYFDSFLRESRFHAIGNIGTIISNLFERPKDAIPSMQALLALAGTQTNTAPLTEHVSGNLFQSYESGKTKLQSEANPYYNAEMHSGEPTLAAAQKLLTTHYQSLAARIAMEVVGIETHIPKPPHPSQSL